MGKIKTAEEVKEALNATATYLSEVPYASKNLLFVAASINKYLNEKESTLDHAFGLKAKRGKYIRKDNEDHIILVLKALKARLEYPPKSWKLISELSGKDENEFRRLWERYKSQAIERLAATIHIDFDFDSN